MNDMFKYSMAKGKDDILKNGAGADDVRNFLKEWSKPIMRGVLKWASNGGRSAVLLIEWLVHLMLKV